MWFFFGFLTLASFVAYSVYERLYSRWHGVDIGSGNQRCRLRLLIRDKKAYGAYIGVDAPAGFHLAFKPERWTDRFSKWAGLSIECQTRDADFDEKIYVVSDDARLCALLRHDAQVRADVLKLFAAADHEPCAVIQVRCGAGRLWVHYKGKRGFNHETAHRLARRLAPTLNALAGRLRDRTPRFGSRLRDPFVWRAIALLAVSTGLALNGLVHLIRLALTTLPFTVDNFGLWQAAILAGASIVTALVLFAILLIGYSARAHLVIAELLLVGSFGAIMTCFIGLRDANMELDAQPATVIETPAIDKRIHRGRRGSRTYYVTVRDWVNVNDSREIRIPSDLYDRMRIGQSVTIRQKPGYLGFRWVESVEPSRNPNGANVVVKPEPGAP
jgi:hypothetical protein